ncbi:MAG TPA: protein-disulfide reductase DsbD domain-containing protein, partial [Novosphingobium sp.]|nr:protein-disulfide reductase DsbD domain-containing protein [Novosphingobium sp.]
LLAEGPARPGETATLALHFKPDPGWHGYWLNPGDAGFGMTLEWTLPEGASAGNPRYPVPDTLLVSGLMNHVYKGDYAVLVPLTLPAKAGPGERIPVSVEARWLACTDQVCVPEQARLTAQLKLGKPAPDKRFDTWQARLPAPLDAAAKFELSGDTVRLAIPLPRTMALAAPHLFVAQDRVADYAAPQRFGRQGDTLVVELARTKTAAANPARLTGVLRLNPDGDGIAFEAAPGAVPSGGAPLDDTAAAPLQGLPLLLLGALIGGLLLNVMPCVFPILSLKALSLARAGESEAQARAEGMAYTAGVVLACLGLGALLLTLRASGQEVGWAFQLQEPATIAALLLLAAAVTANLVGLFEFAQIFNGLFNGPSSAGGSPRGAFATGLLAAFVATPCTGPFMAAAMGAALLLPTGSALLLFAALGLGIALPFLAVAFVPAIRQRLPKPGAWMTTFRRWMALPMGLTALALLWLASRVGGTAFAIAAGLLTVKLIVILVVIGRRQRTGKPVRRLALVWGAVLVAIAVIVLPRTISESSAAAESLLEAKPFSQTALERARASGKPVFVWMTADWCLTCKVNEQVAIEREETRAAFEKAGVVVLRGDWTRRDPAITRYLTAHGAAGVPLYVWYPAAGQGAPEVLPQVLTSTLLMERAGHISEKNQ